MRDFNASNSENTVFSCDDALSMWLQAHTLLTIFHSIGFASTSVCIGMCVLAYIAFDRRYNNQRQLGNGDQNLSAFYHRDIRVFIFQRNLSILIYVFGAFICKLIMSNRRITLLTMARWLIEATIDFPSMFLVLWPPFDEISYNSFDQVDLSMINLFLLSTKFNHFLRMRYAEWNSRAIPNRMLSNIFRHLCRTSYNSSRLNGDSISLFPKHCDCRDFISIWNER